MADLGRGSGSPASCAERVVVQIVQDVEAARARLKLAQERHAYDRRHRSVRYDVGDFGLSLRPQTRFIEMEARLYGSQYMRDRTALSR